MHLLNIVLQGFHVDVIVLYKTCNIFYLVIDIGVVLGQYVVFGWDEVELKGGEFLLLAD